MNILKSYLDNKKKYISLFHTLIRGFSLLLQLLFIKLSINKVSPDQFNIVIIIQTFISLSGIFDFGQPVIAQTFALKSKNSYFAFKKSLKILFFSIGLIFISLFSVFFILGFNSQGILNQTQIFNLFLLLGVSSAFLLLANLATRIAFSSRFGYLLSSVLALPPIINFLYLKYFLRDFSGYNLSILVLTTFLLSSILTLIIFFIKYYKEKNKSISKKFLYVSQKKVLKEGLKVWGASAIGSIILQSDNFILWIVSPSSLVQYYLAMKFANVFLFLVSLDLPRIFSQITLSNELSKIKKLIFLQHIKIVIVSFLTFVSIKLLTNVIWGDSNVGIGLSFLVSLYVFVRSSSDFFSYSLQAIEEYKLPLLYLPFQLAITYCLAIVFVPNIGSLGMVISHLIGFLFTASWILPYYFLKKYQKRLTA
ncbi:MAG: hypothetical protein CMG00_06335 [Candidatus Marinimicrobia bacterium]|nr:hypothetical protein [Candidatus Neomarinimicrobiota bacterium]